MRLEVYNYDKMCPVIMDDGVVYSREWNLKHIQRRQVYVKPKLILLNASIRACDNHLIN